MIQCTRKLACSDHLAQSNICNHKRKHNFSRFQHFKLFLYVSAHCPFQILLQEVLTTGPMTKVSNIPSPLSSGTQADMALHFLNPRSKPPVRKHWWQSITSPATSWTICTSGGCHKTCFKMLTVHLFPILNFLLRRFADSNLLFKLSGSVSYVDLLILIIIKSNHSNGIPQRLSTYLVMGRKW